MEKKCSVLITTYNCMDTIKVSMESILSQINDDFEVIVVDNYSNDGTLEYLEELDRQGKIRLIKRKCNRGEGRQIALEEARGKYVIARVDMDGIHNPIFKRLLEVYQEYEKDLGEYVLNAGVMISSKQFLLKVGYLPLQYGENYELYKRLMDMDKLYFMRVNECSQHLKKKMNLKKRIKTSFINYRDLMRAGLKFRVIAKQLRKTCKYKNLKIILLILAWTSHLFYSRYSTFKGVDWKTYFQDELYQDNSPTFEKYYPDKVIPTPNDLKYYGEMITIVYERV